MNGATLVLRGLRHYRRTHLGVVAGCAISAAVLAGALFVGDSVRASLERAALARLGRIVSAMETGDRYFRDDLPSRIGGGAAAGLRVRGMALRDGAGQVNRVEVIGVDDRFLGFAESPSGLKIGPGRVALGARLAAALGAKAGDDVALRVFKPSLLAKDAPLSSRRERDTVRSLLGVAAVLSDGEFGRFSLKSDQTPPYNAFVDLRWLQEQLELPGWANLLVADGTPDLGKAWRVEDVGLDFRSFPAHGVVQLQSPRIFLDGAAAAAASTPGSVGVLSYLVDGIAAGGKSTPYSFVTALEPGDDRRLGPVRAGMKDDEILLNAWLSERIGAKAGDRVKLTYKELTAGNTYVPKSREFRVRDVLPMAGLEAERALVPEFPGLTDVESCADWEVDIADDPEKLKDKANEEYWSKYRQTPKAFVTLAAGRSMWAGRFGDLMAVRYPGGDAAAPAASARAKLDPAAAGLQLRPARAEALRAAAESMDLGQLFLGMSAFLIAASLILTALLFVFTVEQRAREMGVLLATGFTPGRVRRLFAAEGAVLALLGSLAGLPLGWLFARALVAGLGSAWSGAVADAAIGFHARPASALAALVAGASISLLAMAAALRRQARRPVRELLADDVTLSLGAKGGGLAKAVLVLGAAGAVGVAVAVRSPQGFFGAGALMLAAGLAGLRLLLGNFSTPSSRIPTLRALGLRNAARRPGRGMAAAGMLACGAFIVVSVSAMREDFARSGNERTSGTGGFSLFAESSVPITEDFNDPKGRERLKLADVALLDGVSFTGMKARDGDDASCLNLNQSLTPPLLGVDPATLKGRFGADWGLLEGEGDVVPALVGDAATPVWKLKKPLGSILEYADERGRPFKVKLVGALPMRLSIFQGRLLIAQERFTRLYPSEAGRRVFAADVPPGREAAVIAYLSKRLETAGFDVMPAWKRLEAFYTVERTYLALFQALGALGVLLGSAGMGVLVLRNVLERRAELALLRALGYTKAQAAGVVQAEHRFLALAGLAAGAAASALAVIPSALRPEAQIPVGLLSVFLAATAALALLWIRISANAAMRAGLVPSLRNE